jgi:DnaJ-class molecular chaperone
VPTIDGTAEVQVKPGTQPGDKLRMRGYGVAKDIAGQKGRRGDQFVRVVVTVPRRLSAAQRQLLEELRSGKTSSSSEKTGKGWFS